MSTTTTGWVQEALLPPDAVEITLRVGLVPASDHVQWQLEVTNPSDGTLIAMESTPHAPMSTLQDQLELMCQRLEHEALAGSWTV